MTTNELYLDDHSLKRVWEIGSLTVTCIPA